MARQAYGLVRLIVSMKAKALPLPTADTLLSVILREPMGLVFYERHDAGSIKE